MLQRFSIGLSFTIVTVLALLLAGCTPDQYVTIKNDTTGQEIKVNAAEGPKNIKVVTSGMTFTVDVSPLFSTTRVTATTTAPTKAPALPFRTPITKTTTVTPTATVTPTPTSTQTPESTATQIPEKTAEPTSAQTPEKTAHKPVYTGKGVAIVFDPGTPVGGYQLTLLESGVVYQLCHIEDPREPVRVLDGYAWPKPEERLEDCTRAHRR